MSKSGKNEDVFTSGDMNALSGIEKFFINTVKSGALPQEPMNYDGAAMKAYISYLEAENERLGIENEKIDEYKCVIDDISKQCEELQSENAQLRARLENAVELPFSIGDMAYYCQYINGEGYCLIERKIVGIKQIENEPKWWDRREKIMVAVVQGEKDDGEIGEWLYDIGAFGSEWGNEKTVFENQLAELKGDQQ